MGFVAFRLVNLETFAELLLIRDVINKMKLFEIVFLVYFIGKVVFGGVFYLFYMVIIYRRRRASRSHSSKHKISPSRTGPFTLRTIVRPAEPPPSPSINSTRTCVTLPVLPVRPKTLVTLASLTG